MMVSCIYLKAKTKSASLAKLLSILFLVSFYSSCSHIPFVEENKHAQIEIVVPLKYIPKEQNTPQKGFCRYIDSDNTTQEIEINTENGISSVSILINKNKPTTILFYTDKLDNQPQGFLYPYFTESSITGGFTAFIAYCLYKQSYGTANEITSFIEHFNWVKFQTELDKLANLALEENPDIPLEKTIWSYNIEKILNEIADGTFNTSDLQ